VKDNGPPHFRAAEWGGGWRPGNSPEHAWIEAAGAFFSLASHGWAPQQRRYQIANLRDLRDFLQTEASTLFEFPSVATMKKVDGDASGRPLQRHDDEYREG
jgi:hypothetical protein